MTDYNAVITQVTVLPKGQPIFSEKATTITIVDEAAGPFLEVVQSETGKIQIQSDEWPQLRDSIGEMLRVCDEIEKAMDPCAPDPRLYPEEGP
jgi:hypothetical protein